MRLVLIFALLWSLMVPGASAAEAVPEPDFTPHTETLLLVDLDSGETLYSRNADVVRPMASITKIMTYIVTVEAVPDLEGTQMTIAKEPLKEIAGRGASVCGLEDRVGDSLPVLEVLYGLMLPSGCDAGVELAWFVGNGNVQAFVERMNAKAAELGCTNTRYVDAHGLSEGNQTTAEDLCRIVEYALKTPRFEEIVNTISHQMPGADAPVYNSNSMLNPVSGGRYYNRYVRGIKTGYTYEAGRCLVSTATKGDRNFLCVALGGDYSESTGYVNNAMLDTGSLYDWAFEHFTDNVDVEIGPRFASLQLEESTRLSAGISGASGEEAEITWTSSAPEIASVGPDGTVTAHQLGEAVIRAESQTGNFDTCTVSCGYYNGIELSAECGDYTTGEQQPIRWEAIREAGLDFVMLRAGWGSENYPEQNDAALAENIAGAVEAGIPFGLRFVSYADSVERAQAEAAYFLREVDEVIPEQIGQMTLPLVYDLSDAGFQELDGQTCTGIALAFAQAIGERGYPLMICSGRTVLEGMDLEALDQAGIALWYRSTPYEPDMTTRVQVGGTVPTMWQYRSSLALPGATESNGRVRESLYYMTSAWNADRAAPELSSGLSEDGKSVTLQWTASEEGCSGYRIYCQMEDSDARVEIGSVDAETLTFQAEGHPGQRCTYTVSALFPDPLDPDYQAERTSGEETVQFAGNRLLAEGVDFLESLNADLNGKLPVVLGVCGMAVCLLIALLLLRYVIRSLRRRHLEKPEKKKRGGRERGRREADRHGRRRSS